MAGGGAGSGRKGSLPSPGGGKRQPSVTRLTGTVIVMDSALCRSAEGLELPRRLRAVRHVPRSADLEPARLPVDADGLAPPTVEPDAERAVGMQLVADTRRAVGRVEVRPRPVGLQD